MEIFGVPVAEDTVKNTAVSGAVLLGLWQFVLKHLPWQSWLGGIAAKIAAWFVPKPADKVLVDLDDVDLEELDPDDASVNQALFTLRVYLKGDAQGQALLDALDSYWWKRGCQPTEQVK